MKVSNLGELVDFYSGQIMSRLVVNELVERNPLETWRVVVPKAITSDGSIIENELVTEELRNKPDEKRITAIGDIIIKLSTPFDSATITTNLAGCLIPSFCAIIRNKGIINNNYLQSFLNSKLCKDQIKAKVTGSAMALISISKLKDIEIPIPDQKIQEEIGMHYREVQLKIATMKQIIELESKRNDVIFSNMVKDERN